MSVNKLWTLLYNHQEDRVSTFGLVSSPTRIQVSTEISKPYTNSHYLKTETLKILI